MDRAPPIRLDRERLQSVQTHPGEFSPMCRRSCLRLALLMLLGPSYARAADPSATLGPNSANEPMAETFSIERGARFLDTVSVNWTRQRKCGTCHTNYAHMMARPMVKAPKSAELAEVRAFFRRPRRGMGSSGEAGQAHRGGRGRRRRCGDGAERRGFHRPSSPADTLWHSTGYGRSNAQTAPGIGLTATGPHRRLTITTGPLGPPSRSATRRRLQINRRCSSRPRQAPGLLPRHART